MQVFQFVKFGLVGCVGVVIDFTITWLCKEKLNWNKYLSNSIGFCFAVVNNYWLNKYFTFKNTNPHFINQFLKFLIVSLVGLALSNLFLYLLQKKTAFNFYVSKVFVIAVVFIWNYIANTIFTFNN